MLNIFYGCSGLKTLTIADSTEPLSLNTSSRSTPFFDCPLEALYLGRDIIYSYKSGSATYYNSPFKGKTSLTSLTIGNSVTSIGDRAFTECSGLTSLTIPNSVTSIGYEAFYNCSGLTEVTIGNSVTSIGEGAFRDCSNLTSATIGSGVTSIGESAFYKCSGLTSVTIPNSVTSIGSSAFYECSGLTEVNIGNNVTSIGDWAFSGCSKLTSVTIPNSVTSIGEGAFRNCSGMTEVTIGNSITSIGYEAFYNCSGLTILTIADGTEPLSLNTSSSSTPFFNCPLETLYLGRDIIYSYYNSPFKGKTSLTSLTIGNSVTSIGEGAFRGCGGLTSVTIGSSVTSIGKDAFSSCRGLIIKSLAQTLPIIEQRIDAISLEVPLGCCHAYINADNWNEIDSIYAMDNNTKLYPISLNVEGEEVVSIKEIANKDWEVPENTKIEIVPQGKLVQYCLVIKGGSDISEEIKNKGYFSFLSSPLYKDNVISTYAYEISEIHIATAGTLIERIGVENVEKIYSLKVSGNLNGTDILTIRKMTNLKILDMEDAKIVNGGQSYYKDYITSENAIGEYFFYEKKNLIGVLLPKNIKIIKEKAFAGCVNLKTIAIPNSVTSIGKDVFSGCGGLTTLTIADGTETLSCSISSGYTPFPDCPLVTIYLGRDISCDSYYPPFRDKKTLTSLTIGNSVTSIGGTAFLGCSGLTSVTIGNSVTSIGGSAFYGCCGLTSVTIPNSVKSIGPSVFSGCSGLLSISVESGNTVYDSRNYCNAIIESSTNKLIAGCKNTTIPNSVTCIGESAFDECSGLTSVTIPNSVTSIGESAFESCI